MRQKTRSRLQDWKIWIKEDCITKQRTTSRPSNQSVKSLEKYCKCWPLRNTLSRHQWGRGTWLGFDRSLIEISWNQEQGSLWTLQRWQLWEFYPERSIHWCITCKQKMWEMSLSLMSAVFLHRFEIWGRLLSFLWQTLSFLEESVSSPQREFCFMGLLVRERHYLQEHLRAMFRLSFWKLLLHPLLINTLVRVQESLEKCLLMQKRMSLVSSLWMRSMLLEVKGFLKELLQIEKFKELWWNCWISSTDLKNLAWLKL